MDYAAQVKMTVRSLKGPALSVLVLMVWSRQWHPLVWDVKELIAGTGYDNEAISKARLTLIGLGLCEPAERGRIGLRLVDRAVQQLGLWDALPPVGEVVEGTPPQVRSENPISSGSSGSSSLIDRERDSLTQPRLLPEVRSEKPISLPHPDLDRLVDLLAGCPRPRAVRAVQAALDRGDWPIEIEIQIAWWSLYVSSPLGKTINSGVMFVAAKIEQGELCPDFLHSRPRSNFEWSDWKDHVRAEVHRIDDLQRELDRMAGNDEAAQSDDMLSEEADDEAASIETVEADELPTMSPLKKVSAPENDRGQLAEAWSIIGERVSARSADFYRLIFAPCVAVRVCTGELTVRVPRACLDLFEQSRAKLEVIASEVMGDKIRISVVD